jgi:hypothetical protein
MGHSVSHGGLFFFLAKHGNVGNGVYMFESTMCIEVSFELSFYHFIVAQRVDMQRRLKHKLLLHTPNNLHISLQGCLWFAVNDGDGSKHC